MGRYYKGGYLLEHQCGKNIQLCAILDELSDITKLVFKISSPQGYQRV